MMGSDSSADVNTSTQDPASIAQALRGIWEKTLEHREFTDEVSFFEVGGDSFKAVMLIGEINEAFPRQMTLRQLFYHQTLAAQTAVLAASSDTAETRVDG
jgi:acyl carrier protein